MKPESSPPLLSPLNGPILQKIILVDRLVRRRKQSYESSSLPGHLVQLVTTGESEQRTSGRIQHLSPGKWIWYFEDEPVMGKITKAPFSFYTVSFVAPTLPPPPYDNRTGICPGDARKKFQDLLDAWKNLKAPPLSRHMRVHSLLLDLLREIHPGMEEETQIDEGTGAWWKIESRVRSNLSEPVSLASLCRISNRSQRTIIRACHRATGLSPMKRIKELRLNYARGMVLHSDLTMSEIAYRVGFGRVQEFSRDYGRIYGVTPVEDRKRGPDYRKIRSPGKSPRP